MVYEQFLPLADKMYLTIVEKDFDADTFFSEIDFSEWELIEKETIQDDSSVDFSYRYETWIRRR
jgi:dihydrofolate reductase